MPTRYLDAQPTQRVRCQTNDADDSSGSGPGSGTSVIARPKVQAREPSLYQVLLHNDDYTPMEFVITVLESVFRYDYQTAQKIMLDVHYKGVGRCGVYPYDIAETKVSLVSDSARQHEYPLKCTMEKA